MDNDEIQGEIAHNRELIKVYTKRLHILELQSAKFGLHVPPHILIEIDEIAEKIQICERKIEVTQLLSQKHNKLEYVFGNDTAIKINDREGWDLKTTRIGLEFGILSENDEKILLSPQFLEALNEISKKELSNNPTDYFNSGLPLLCVKAILRTHPGGELYKEDLDYLASK